MVLKYLVVVFLSLLSLELLGNEKLGIKQLQNYDGPLFPLELYDLESQRYRSRDEYFQELYIDSKLTLSFNQLEHFLKEELPVGLTCPNTELKEHSETIQFLLRALSYHYLYQAGKEYNYLARKMNLQFSCPVTSPKFLKRCQPRSLQMKKYVKNLNFILESEKANIIPFKQTKKSEKRRWYQQVRQRDKKDLLQFECSLEGCKNMTQKVLLQKLRSSCSENKKLVVAICSERDQLWGLSSIPAFYQILSRVQSLGQGPLKSCLGRFIRSYEHQEKKSEYLKSIMSYFIQKIDFSNPTLGRTFDGVMLNQFKEAPLLSLEEQKTEEKISLGTKNKQKVIPKIEEITLPKYVKPRTPKVQKKKKVKKLVVKKVENQKTSFALTSDFRQKHDLALIKVNMFKFRYDYFFGQHERERLTKLIKRFSSQKSLKKMVKFDHLGKMKAPVPLRFVKLLLETNDHQSLFNLIIVLGERFFVINDLDKSSQKIDFIELKNDKTTDFKWAITILRPYQNHSTLQ